MIAAGVRSLASLFVGKVAASKFPIVPNCTPLVHLNHISFQDASYEGVYCFGVNLHRILSVLSF